jgi:hypothetical protein
MNAYVNVEIHEGAWHEYSVPPHEQLRRASFIASIPMNIGINSYVSSHEQPGEGSSRGTNEAKHSVLRASGPWFVHFNVASPLSYFLSLL